MANSTGRTNDLDYLRYGIEVLITGTIKFLCLYLSAFFLGILEEMICLSLTFILFRLFSGGYHYSKYQHCLLAGLLIFNSFSYISLKVSPIVNESIVYLLFMCTCIGLFTCFRYAPSNHFYRKMIEDQKKKLRNCSLILIFIWGLFLFILVKITVPSSLILSSITGFILQMVTLYPATYRISQKFEGYLNKEVSIR